MKVTAEFLTKNHACEDWVKRFAKTFPSGLSLTHENWYKACEAGFARQLSWIFTEIGGEEFRPNLSNFDLRGLQLADAFLAGANLSNANLNGMQLGGINLNRTILVGATMIKAQMVIAKLAHANLTGVDLSGANLGGADLTCANFYKANLCGVSFSGADMTNVVLHEAKYDGKTIFPISLNSRLFKMVFMG